VQGGKREARRVANDLERVGNRSAPGGRKVDDALNAWIAQNLPTWAASSARDQQSRVRSIKQDPIARVPLARLSVSDIKGWHARLRRAGVNDPAIRNQHIALRAALSQAVRWGWASTNAASLARLRATKAEPRQAMSLEDVNAVLAAAATVDPAAELALRLSAVAGARRAELTALRWDDVRDRLLTIDSAIETVPGWSGRSVRTTGRARGAVRTWHGPPGDVAGPPTQASRHVLVVLFHEASISSWESASSYVSKSLATGLPRPVRLPSSTMSNRSRRGDAFARYGVSARSACRVRQARPASCRLKRVSGDARSWPEISRMRCRRYLSVLRCTDSARAVAS